METRNIQIPSNLISELQIPQIINIIDALPKRGERGWDELEDPRNINALTDIAWHHTAEFEADNVAPETHANNHIRAGEGGFPYHFYIKKGQLYQGNDLLTFTYGVASNNAYTVHCAVEGCYSPAKGRPPDVLSDENLRAMIGLELTLRQVMPAYRRTNGHNFYRATACPGFSMSWFREEVSKVELRLKDRDSIAQKCFKGAEQHRYLYNEYLRDPVNNKWLEPWLLELHDIMKERGMFFGQ